MPTPEPLTFVDPVKAQQYRQAGLWPDRTIADAFDAVVARTPDKVLLVAPGSVRLTYRTVAEKVAVIAQNLTRLGIGHGDVVSVQLPNWAEFLLLHLAATRVGAVTNPLLAVYRAKELTHILNCAGTKLAVIPREFRNFDFPRLYRDMRPKLPHLEHIFVVGTDYPQDMKPFDDLLRPISGGEPAWRRFSGDDVSVLVFTSGTESSPKGVMHTHNTLMYGNVKGAERLGLTDKEVIWGVSPVSHATGLEWCVRQAIVLGATVVMQDVWDVEAALDLIEREKCTFTTAATPFASMLLTSPTLANRDLRSFRVFLCGGAAIPPALGAAMFEQIGCRLIPCWGMSECFAATMGNISDSKSAQWGSDGRPMPGSETVIFDESRTKQLEPGQVGEIATRGPHVSAGYFKDSERTAATFSPDGWLFSNDLGFKDEHGYLHVVGRKKDIINRGGLKISAAEVEGLLVDHPAIEAVAIVGVPDVSLGEKSCAFVVAAQATAPTLSGVVDFLKGSGIASYKLPEYLVLVPDLPMTPTGKIQKFVLRDKWVQGLYRQNTEG